MKKFFAFTLAEVLLTMTIVGTVAAMTIPTLQYQKIKKEYTAKLKNFYSHVENAILDMQMDKGSFRDINYDQTSGKINGMTPYNWYMEYIDPYMGHEMINDTNKKIYFKDGSAIVQIFAGDCLDIVYDVNADKGPNREGYDRYRYLICYSDAQRAGYFGNKDIFFGTYASGLSFQGATRAQMLSKCKSAPQFCTRLLQNDQWEFKTDYPYKF